MRISRLKPLLQTWVAGIPALEPYSLFTSNIIIARAVGANLFALKKRLFRWHAFIKATKVAPTNLGCGQRQH